MLGNKEIMADNIKYYMDRKGIDRNKLCSDLDLKYMTVSDWINAKSYPRIDKIELLANYFGVQKSDLVEPRSNNIEKPSIDLADLRENIVFFEGEELSDEELEKIAQIIQLTLR
ncbi:helix-turn-helix transcriptional regulator [Streptococcus suis]|nr:helix-turn-helix transcriptional regulator [Streptococcus suis]